MAEAFWDKEVEIATYPKNNRGEEIKIKKVKKGNKTYVDVRTFYMQDGVQKPGKGVSIPDDLADEIAQSIIESGKVEI